MAKWIPAWRYVPIDYNQELGALENVTQKCVFTSPPFLLLGPLGTAGGPRQRHFGANIMP